MGTVKVLLAGDCRGNFGALFNRVATVNKKNGPFNILFCVGDFFAPGDPHAPIPDELQPYVDGSKQLPVETYFLGARGAGAGTALEALKSSPAALHWLGRAGVVELQGLNVAYLDGSYDAGAFGGDPSDQAPCCTHYTELDAGLLRQQLRDLGGEVDLLLTCDWPQGVLRALPAPVVDSVGLAPGVGSPAINELAQLARPRYHVTARQGVYWQRPPYVNPDQGVGRRATRFIALGAVGGAAPPAAPRGKAAAAAAAAAPPKFLHALGLQPSGEMAPEQLAAVPEGALECPYASGGGRGGGKRPAGAAAEQDEPGGFSRWASTGKRQRGGASSSAPFQPWGDPSVPKDAEKTAFVKNLPWDASYAEVERFFSAAGTVVTIRRGAREGGGPNSWAHVQFGASAAVGEACRLNGCQLMGRELYVDAANSGMGRPSQQQQQQQQQRGQGQGQGGEAVSSCWFCLSSPSVDTNLVVSVADECYLALDKGQINPHHVLLVPIEHYPSTVALPPGCFEEMQRYLSSLRGCFAAQGGAFVGFERHLRLRHQGGNHCHVQALSVSRAAGERAEAAFRQAMQAVASGEVVHIGAAGGRLDRAALQEAVGSSEYFLALLPDGCGLVSVLQQGDRWPMQLGRQVLCDLADAPSRMDWKACTAAPEAEAVAAEAFKARFKPYDIMSDD